MTESRSPRNLLEELDARQDEVLEELERLNERIERLLVQYLTARRQSPEC
jgi:hypothetical protein